MKNILHKLKVIIYFFFSMIFFNSCNIKEKAETNTKLIPPTNIIDTIELNDLKPIMKQSEDIIIKNFDDESIIFSTFRSREISDKDDILQYFYNKEKLVNIGSVETMIASSESKLEKNRILYTTRCVIEENKLINKIYKINIENQKFETLIEIEDMLPLSYIFDLDKNHILYYCVSENESDKYCYYINKINLNTAEMETIVQSEFERGKSSGKLISCINTYNKKIYAYTIIDQKPSVEVYDVNGKFIESIQLNMRKLSNPIFTIDVFEDIVILSTLNSEVIVFKIEKNKCNEICYISECVPLYPSYNNYKSDNIYIADSYDRKHLYVINRITKELKKYSINAENDDRKIQWYKCNNHGDILVWTYDKDSFKNFNYYIIKNDRLK